MDFLDDLNESQRKAVEYCDGPSLVIAGAGSGKTRVLTYKIAYLLSRGMKPWNILALTFTNKAANEMKQRIGALVGNDMARKLNMGTFHSVFSRILRVEAQLLGYAPNFTIYDESDSQSLLKNIVKEMGLDSKLYKPALVHSRISLAKNNLVLPQDYAMNKEWLAGDEIMQIPGVYKIYPVYCERCRNANAMDFDDLLINTFNLFKNNENVRLKYATRFKYILVDEYQDTNNAQQEILLQLSQDNPYICAVGDDAQSIYSFRGANIQNILNFDKYFNGTRIFKLEQNYRSTQYIVKASNSLISHNNNQIKKELYSLRDKGDKLLLKGADNEIQEAEMVCLMIVNLLRKNKYRYRDFAVFYRISSLSKNFEDAMSRHGIPYKVYGGLGFYQHKEIKDILSYFRLVVNPDDEESFKRAINTPKRGIGNTTLSKIIGLASVHGVSPWKIICAPDDYGLSIPKSTLERIEKFRLLINSFILKKDDLDARALCYEIYELSELKKEVEEDASFEAPVRGKYINDLFYEVENFVEDINVEDKSIEAFLREKSLLSDKENDEKNDDFVSLMTVHNAKGLEFPIVFVVGLEENIFPVKRAVGKTEEEEEERRLFYVAITRAEHTCVLTYAKERYLYGEKKVTNKSRFLDEIEQTLLKGDVAHNITHRLTRGDEYGRFGTSERWQNSRPVASQFRADPKVREVGHYDDAKITDTFSPGFKRMMAVSAMKSRGGASSVGKSSAIDGLREDCMIEHERFGVGKVIRLEGSGENLKATVQFTNAGVKQLLVKFARFKVIG